MSDPSPMKKPWHWPFEKPDWVVALAAGLVSLIGYVWSAQPNVGLLDSGEFLTAAIHMGVPHPTGYPLWTIGSWLFQLLPLGNNAWEVNLFSGFCTAVAVGLVALILVNSMRWAGVGERLAQIWAVAWSLALACSVSMWSQAVIAEVYGLHSLCVMLFLLSLYRWLRVPDWNAGLAWGAFFYALGMSNHHLMISMAILLVLVPALVRRDFFAESLLYLAGAAALVYGGFGYLSQEPATWHASIRFLWCVGAVFLLWLVIRRRLEHWRTGLLVLAGVTAGLSPYLYMPMASATNPPMNWGFASTKEGFFYSFNRSQYDGKLSDQLLKTVGRAMGAAPPEILNPPAPADPQQSSFRQNFTKFSLLYWRKVVENFSPLGLLALVGVFLLGTFFGRQTKTLDPDLCGRPASVRISPACLRGSGRRRGVMASANAVSGLLARLLCSVGGTGDRAGLPEVWPQTRADADDRVGFGGGNRRDFYGRGGGASFHQRRGSGTDSGEKNVGGGGRGGAGKSAWIRADPANPSGWIGGGGKRISSGGGTGGDYAAGSGLESARVGQAGKLPVADHRRGFGGADPGAAAPRRQPGRI